MYMQNVVSMEMMAQLSDQTGNLIFRKIFVIKLISRTNRCSVGIWA